MHVQSMHFGIPTSLVRRPGANIPLRCTTGLHFGTTPLTLRPNKNDKNTVRIYPYRIIYLHVGLVVSKLLMNM